METEETPKISPGLSHTSFIVILKNPNETRYEGSWSTGAKDEKESEKKNIFAEVLISIDHLPSVEQELVQLELLELTVLV